MGRLIGRPPKLPRNPGTTRSSSSPEGEPTRPEGAPPGIRLYKQVETVEIDAPRPGEVPRPGTPLYFVEAVEITPHPGIEGQTRDGRVARAADQTASYPLLPRTPPYHQPHVDTRARQAQVALAQRPGRTECAMVGDHEVCLSSGRFRWQRSVRSRCGTRGVLTSREAGTVVLWKDSKGFGQIRANNGDIVFFANSEIEGTLSAGQRVELPGRWVWRGACAHETWSCLTAQASRQSS